MPQSLGSATGYSASTTYDAGVAELTDSANIIDAFKYYHYGQNFNGSTGLGGIELHLRNINSNITTVSNNLSASVSSLSSTINSTKYISISNITSSSPYTLQLSNDGQLIAYLNSASTTFTIPPESGSGSVPFLTGTQINILQKGSGTVLAAGGTGVTVNGTPGKRTRTTYALATYIKIGSNEWVVVGDTVT